MRSLAVPGNIEAVWRTYPGVFGSSGNEEGRGTMKKVPKVLAAVLAVGFAVTLGAAPAVSADASPAFHSMLDTGWD
jgi:hypothetical protein